jgi:phage tail protein X
MVVYETSSLEGIATVGTMFPDPLTTSFPDTLPSPAKVQIATALFVPE